MSVLVDPLFRNHTPNSEEKDIVNMALLLAEMNIRQSERIDNLDEKKLQELLMDSTFVYNIDLQARNII